MEIKKKVKIIILNPLLRFWNVFNLNTKSKSSNLLSTAQVSSLSSKPNHNTPRLVLAYIDLTLIHSDYFYWDSSWDSVPPSFRGVHISDSNSYKVKYWSPIWRSILYGKENSLIDLLINRGFDGVLISTEQHF